MIGMTNVTETEGHIEYDFTRFGIPFAHVSADLLPIDEACAKCSKCHAATTKECQAMQRQFALDMGMPEETTVICPEQFINETDTKI